MFPPAQLHCVGEDRNLKHCERSLYGVAIAFAILAEKEGVEPSDAFTSTD